MHRTHPTQPHAPLVSPKAMQAFRLILYALAAGLLSGLGWLIAAIINRP